MKRTFVVVMVTVAVVAVLAVLLLSSGGSPSDGLSSSHSTPSETSSETPSEIHSPSPPLNVRIDYIGVKNAGGHNDLLPDDSDGEVQLVVVVADGKTPTPGDQVYIPLTKQGYKMGDFETIEINQRVFHTSSIGDYLKVSIIAYDVDSKTQTLDLLSTLEMLGAPGAAQLRVIIELLPQEDDLIGCYQRTWHKDEDWGIGQYREVAQNTFADDNFLVGISIWSEGEPSAIPTPILLPDVKILNVDVPSQIKKRSGSEWITVTTYPVTAILVNDEAIDVELEWEVSCEIGTIYYAGFPYKSLNGTVAVPAGGSKILQAQYCSAVAGVDQINWRISYKGKEFDSRSDTLDVIS